MKHYFACGKVIKRKLPFEADTRDGQTVFVGPECFKLVIAAGEVVSQPPKGGPRLYMILVPIGAPNWPEAS